MDTSTPRAAGRARTHFIVQTNSTPGFWGRATTLKRAYRHLIDEGGEDFARKYGVMEWHCGESAYIGEHGEIYYDRDEEPRLIRTTKGALSK